MLKLIALFLLFIGLAVPVLTQAQIVPCGFPGGPKCEVKHFFELIVNIYNVLLGFLAIVAIMVLIWSGVRMLLHQIAEQPEAELTAAKTTFTRAIWGLVIILCAFLIVNTLLIVLQVDPCLFQDAVYNPIRPLLPATPATGC